MINLAKSATLTQFIRATSLPSGLVRAVVAQLGGWEDFTAAAPDIANHGIDGGFHGFIYTADTERFARANRKEIEAMAASQADDLGTTITEMIQGFGCFRHGSKPSELEIGRALYAGESDEDGVLNALAWYAGEEVARAYVDFTEE